MRPVARCLAMEIMLSGQAINVHKPMPLGDPKRSTDCHVALALSGTKECCKRLHFRGQGRCASWRQLGVRRAPVRRLGQSRGFQGAVDTSSEDIEGKSARLSERHRQVEAFGPQLRDFARRTGMVKCAQKLAAGGDAASARAIEPPYGASGDRRRLRTPTGLPPAGDPPVSAPLALEK